MDYVHHIIGIGYGLMLTFRQNWVCEDTCPIKNLYTYAQVNEFSTLFYSLYRMTRKPAHGMVFAVAFFFSRIVFNFATIVPVSFQNCSLFGFFMVMVTYQSLQCIWMGMIIKKALSRGSKRSDHDKVCSNGVSSNGKGSSNGISSSSSAVANSNGNSSSNGGIKQQ
jgi:uncharacterized membrane protein YgcG